MQKIGKYLSVLIVSSVILGCSQSTNKLLVQQKKVKQKEVLPSWILNPIINGNIASIGKCRPTANDENQMQFAIDKALMSLSKGISDNTKIKVLSNMVVVRKSHNSLAEVDYKNHTDAKIVTNGVIKAKLTHIYYDKNNILYVRLEAL